PLLTATGPDEPPRPGGEPLPPPTPREPEVTPPAEPPSEPPSEPPTEPGREAPTTPDPEVVPPGIPFREPEPEPDVPDGPGVSDPDLAPGAPLSPPDYAPEQRYGGRTPDRMDPDGDDRDAPYDTASLPPDHPAYDRIQHRPRHERSRRSRIGGFLTAAALVVAGLVVTYALVRPDDAPGDIQDLLTLAAEHADAVSLEVVTSDLDVAQQYIVGEFGWPIRVPVLPEARLEGVGVAALVEGVEVPVLRYRTTGDAPVVVYAYDYAFLDAAADRLRLAPPVYARLADEPPVDVRRVGDRYLVLWRRRAAIYTAVTSDDPAPLVEYLSRR
ncbi:MAG TPA: hypothetical protein VK002_15245, partial [Rubricoccaceae bacterium]|nr:hypothetical protein [Rubricoccaceae bacterium]